MSLTQDRPEVVDRKSEVRYASTDDGSVAYRAIAGDEGTTHDLILLVSGTASMEALFEDPIGSRLVRGFARLGRVVEWANEGARAGGGKLSSARASLHACVEESLCERHVSPPVR